MHLSLHIIKSVVDGEILPKFVRKYVLEYSPSMQRFGGAVNLNIHFHSLVLDGVYYQDDRQRIRFKRLPPPCNGEVARVTACIARRIIRLLERRGLGPSADPEEADPLLRDQPLLAELYAASVQRRIAVGPRAGNLLTVFGTETEDEDAAVPSGLS
jgi:hypothetical protein